MITTITKRLLQGLVVVFAILVITFILLRLIPGGSLKNYGAGGH